MTTRHCSIWLDGCHSQPVPYSNNSIDVCQQEQLETVWNQQDLSQGVIKRPLLADRHRRSRLAWCLARRGWNIRTWRKIHWSDESRFLLHVTDGQMRVWRHKNTAYTPRNIQPTVPYGGGSVMVWGCISHDCLLDLVTIQGNLTGDQYIRDVFATSCCPPFRQQIKTIPKLSMWLTVRQQIKTIPKHSKWLTVRQQIKTIPKLSSNPAIPTIHVIRINNRTPNIFCIVGRYTPNNVPSLA